MKTKVVLRAVSDETLRKNVRESMELCDWKTLVPRDGTVVLKPNLCTIVPDQMEKSNTDIRITSAVCEVLLERTNHIYIGEADHLRRTADQAFEQTGHVQMAQRLGIQVVNFTKLPTVAVPCSPIGKLELPRLLIESDAFITLPVLKTHALTYFTGSLKNQWGCVPQHNRILLHRVIDQLLASLQKAFHPKLAVMDAIVAMEGRGPVNGPARHLDLILVGQDAVAVDATAMRLVGLRPERARHVVLAAEQGLGKMSPEEIEIDGDWAAHSTQFKPGEMDWAIASMLYMSQYSWFVKYILENDYVFKPVRSFVSFLRKLGLVGNG